MAQQATGKTKKKAEKKQLLTAFNQTAQQLRRGDLERAGKGIKRERQKQATRLSLAFQTSADKAQPAAVEPAGLAPVSIGIAGKTVEITAALTQDDGQFLQKVKLAGQEGLTTQENVGVAEHVAQQLKAKTSASALKNNNNNLACRKA